MKTRKRTPRNRKAILKKRNQVLVVSLIAISLMISQVARAAVLDLVMGDTTPAVVATESSFNSLYASVINGPSSDTDSPPLVANAIAAVSSPEGGVSKTIRRSYTVTVSAYNSEVAQTDASPFITASGTHVRDGIVATNMFPFGTAIKIPSLYGDKIFVVEDRMNARYRNNVDVWMVSKADALKLGRRTVKIEVIR